MNLFKNILFGFVNPLHIALGILVITLLIIAFIYRKKIYLFGGILVLVGALVLGSLSVFLFKKVNNPFRPLTSTAVFKKMEYIQHLQLVAHYSEEIVMIGTEEKVRQIVERREKELKIAESTVARFEDSIQFYKGKIGEIYQTVDDEQKSLSASLKVIEEYQECYKAFFKDGQSIDSTSWICNKELEIFKVAGSESMLEMLFGQYKKSYREWVLAQSNFDNKTWKQLPKLGERLKERKKQKDELGIFQSELSRKHGLLCSAIESRLSRQWNTISENTLSKLDTKKAKKEQAGKYLALLETAEDGHKKALKTQKTAQDRLAEAKTELIFAEELGEDLEPELLVILPAEVSVYIDMSEIVIHEDSLEKGVVYVRLPELKFDPVLVDLPEDSVVYQLDRKDSEFQSSQQGAYYELFSQLKEAVLDLEVESKKKAIENGILEEGDKMIKEYEKH